MIAVPGVRRACAVSGNEIRHHHLPHLEARRIRVDAYRNSHEHRRPDQQHHRRAHLRADEHRTQPAAVSRVAAESFQSVDEIERERGTCGGDGRDNTEQHGEQREKRENRPPRLDGKAAPSAGRSSRGATAAMRYAMIRRDDSRDATPAEAFPSAAFGRDAVRPHLARFSWPPRAGGHRPAPARRDTTLEHATRARHVSAASVSATTATTIAVLPGFWSSEPSVIQVRCGGPGEADPVARQGP